MGWLTGWDVRKKHTLTGSVAGAQSDYQLRFEVHYGAGVDAGEVVYCDSKCRTDFGDIRFTAADGFTELDYWIEEQTDGVNAIIWVEVPSILADPATTDIYIYYGNAGAATTSSGDDTFILWNDCDDVGEWTVDNIRAGPTWGTTVIDGVTTIYLFSTGDTDRLRLRFNTANSRRENSRFFSRIKHTEFQTDSYFIYYLGRQPVTSLNHDYIYYGSFYDVYKTTAVVNGVGGTDEYDVGHPNGWYRYEGTVNSDGKLTIHRDVTELGTYTQDGDYADAHPMFHVSQFAEQGAVRIYVDYFAVGKYVDPEPTHTSWGPEVSGGIKSVFAKFVVKQWQEDLAAEFVVRYGKENLPAEFMIKQETSVDLLGEFVVRHDGIPVDLLGEFVVSRSVPSALVLGPQNVATATYWALAWPYQRKVWYSAGRHWVFYEHDNQLRYVSSVDGVTWDGPTDIRGSCSISYLFGTWVDDNGYLHYVFCRSGNNRTLKYRRGLLESDGTITWSVEQDAAPSHAKEQFRPSICVDDAGYPWITYTREDTVKDYLDATMVTKSSTNDGTWTTAPNYPVEIYPPSAQEITTNITPIASGKAFVTRTGGNASRIRGWLCDDDGPGASQRLDLPTDVTGEYGITTIVSLGDTAWVAIDTDAGTYVAKYQDGNWVGIVQVDAAGTWPPSIFMVGGHIYVAWLQIEGGGAPNSWMRRISMDGGTTWGASGVLLYAPGGVSRGYYANFAPHLESPLSFAWLKPAPGLAIEFGWIDVVSAPELICSFNVGQDVGELKATFAIRRIGTPQNLHAAFELQISVDLLGEFIVRQSGPVPWIFGWSLRKSHTITGSVAGVQTNYPIGIKVYYGSGTDGTETIGGATFGKVYCDSKCRVDFGDIRFTKSDYTSLLDYWIEEQVDSDYAIIWVEVDRIPASPGTTYIYVYYGNAGASTTSNGDNTFLIFNDCATTTGWSVQTITGSPIWGTATVDGVQTILIEANNHNEKLRIQYDTLLSTGRENRRGLTRVKHTSWNADGYFYWYTPLLIGSPSEYDSIRYSSYFDKYTTYASVGGVGDNTDYGVGHPSGWYRYEKKTNAAGEVTGYRNDTDLGTATVDGDYSGGKVMYYVNEWNSGLTRHYIDWFAIGKYVDPEPTHITWGSANTLDGVLPAQFEVGQDSVDFPARFEVGQGSAELLGEFEAQAVAELLSRFEAQATTELLGKFEVGQGSAELLAWFLIPRAYNFSSGMGISFDWWGSGGVDQNIDFEMWSLTGGWVGRFPDGPAEWRHVQLSWDDLTPVDLDGTKPDSSQIIGIYWTYHTPGIRRIDGIRAWMRQDLLCKVVIRNASDLDLLGKFEAQASLNLLAGLIVRQGTAEILGKFEIP